MAATVAEAYPTAPAATSRASGTGSPTTSSPRCWPSSSAAAAASHPGSRRRPARSRGGRRGRRRAGPPDRPGRDGRGDRRRGRRRRHHHRDRDGGDHPRHADRHRDSPPRCGAPSQLPFGTALLSRGRGRPLNWTSVVVPPSDRSFQIPTAARPSAWRPRPRRAAPAPTGRGRARRWPVGDGRRGRGDGRGDETDLGRRQPHEPPFRTALGRPVSAGRTRPTPARSVQHERSGAIGAGRTPARCASGARGWRTGRRRRPARRGCRAR
jgi:hypothetical protein